MYISRFVSLLSRPVLAGRAARALVAPGRLITTGRDLTRLGNVSGKRRASQDDSHRSLDNFLGTWEQQTIQRVDIAFDQKETRIPISFEGEFYKPYAIYTRSQDLWSVELGFVDMSMDICYTFKLDEDFVFIFPDNTINMVTVYQGGDRLFWKFQPLSPDPSASVHTELAVLQTNTVKGDKLFVKTEYPENIVIMKTYVRK
ncbi:hypothetical protein BsWGS_08596 [Bradybaena similaris]